VKWVFCGVMEGAKSRTKQPNDIRRFDFRKTFCSLGLLAPVDLISSLNFFFFVYSNNFFLEPFS